MTDAAAIITRLQLKRHPEGGWFRETWRAPATNGERAAGNFPARAAGNVPARAAGTTILYLLDQGERSHWHRIDATEIWLFQAGSPLLLRTAFDSRIIETRLGSNILAGDQPQAMVAPHQWQAAEAQHGWSLVACVVVPGFEFGAFELAPAGWSPLDMM